MNRHLLHRLAYLPLLCLCLLFPVEALASSPTFGPLNPDFLAWREQAAAKVAAPSMHRGRIPSPVDLSHLRGLRLAPEGKTGKAAFPASYDLRTLGRVSPIRDQDPYGTCWAFAALGALES